MARRDLVFIEIVLDMNALTSRVRHGLVSLGLHGAVLLPMPRPAFLGRGRAAVRVGLRASIGGIDTTTGGEQTMSASNTIGILFVCLGNICRSPTAEGVFRRLADERGLSPYLRVDSAGTHAYHVGEPPDPRSQKAAKARGIDLSVLRARRVDHGDFYQFDHILAMDANNFANLMDMRPPDASAQVKYFLDYAPHLNIREVPDPYYGGGNGFERVLDMVEDASMGLLDELEGLLRR